MKRALIATCFLVAAQPVLAGEDMSGNYWLPICTQGDNGHCLSFISSIASMNRLHLIKEPFCAPDGVTLGQMVTVVIKQLRNEPQNLHKDFGLLALDALRRTWPCRQS